MSTGLCAGLFCGIVFIEKEVLVIKNLVSISVLCLTSIVFSVCSAPKIFDARKLNLFKTSDFFAYKKDKAIAYFVCGNAIQKNVMFGDIDMAENFWCSFSINCKPFKKAQHWCNCRTGVRAWRTRYFTSR